MNTQSVPDNDTTPLPKNVTRAWEPGEAAKRYPNLMRESTPEDQERFDRQREAERAEGLRSDAKAKWDRVAREIGKRYERCRLESYVVDPGNVEQVKAFGIIKEYCGSLIQRVDAGDGLVLFGNPGTGKDHLIAALLYEATMKHRMECKWVNGLDWFGSIRDGMDRDEAETTKLEPLTRPEVLAMSDPLPPFGKLTEFQSTMLFRAIDKRYRDLKPTWMTLNVENSKEAEKRMGPNIIDRLKDRVVNVHCDWPSYRARKTS